MPFLETNEVEPLPAIPDLDQCEGRRDHALIALAVQTGLRLSELIGITRGDIQLGVGATSGCTAKAAKNDASR